MRAARARKAELGRMLAQCASGTVSDCWVIESLGNHALCTHHAVGEA
ncbi:hypothetical protein KTN05_16960 [Paracoccus sp. Z118]|nr:hypothetical protein [Paracoccus sp. Z118]